MIMLKLPHKYLSAIWSPWQLKPCKGYDLVALVLHIHFLKGVDVRTYAFCVTVKYNFDCDTLPLNCN